MEEEKKLPETEMEETSAQEETPIEATEEVEETQETEEIEGYGEVVGNEILDLIRSEISGNELSEKLGDYHEADIAEIFDQLTKEER